MTVEELRDRLNGLIGDVVRQMPPDAYGDPDGTIPPVIDSLIAAAEARGVAKLLANPISRGTLYVNTGGIGDLPDGQYPTITVLAPAPKEEMDDESEHNDYSG